MELLLLNIIEGSEFLGAPLFDAEDFWRLILKTVFNLSFNCKSLSKMKFSMCPQKCFLYVSKQATEGKRRCRRTRCG